MDFSIEYLQKVLRFVSDNFENENLIIKIIWLCIPLFILTFFITFFLIFKYRRDLNINSKKRLENLNEYQKLVVSIVTIKENEIDKKQRIVKKVKAQTKSTFNRELILEVLLKLHGSISGESSKRLEDLYVASGLYSFSVIKLKSSKWHIKIKGMRELAQMKVFDDLRVEVPKLLNHKNRLLRANAQQTVLKLDGVIGLNFITNYKEDLYRWQQIELMENLFKIKGPTFYQIHNWLKAENASVNLFALKIVKAYSLINQKENLQNLASSTHHLVRKEALNLIVMLKLKEASFDLVGVFEKSKEYFEKKRLLDAIQAINTADFGDYVAKKRNEIEEDNNHKVIVINA